MSGKNPLWRKRNDAVQSVAIAVHGEIPRPEDHPLLPPQDPLWSLIMECWNEDPEARPSMEFVLKQVRFRLGPHVNRVLTFGLSLSPSSWRGRETAGDSTRTHINSTVGSR